MELDQTEHVIATLDLDADLRLTENTEHKLRAILELSGNIGISLDVDAVLTRVLDSLLEIFPKADCVTIVLLNKKNQLVTMPKPGNIVLNFCPRPAPSMTTTPMKPCRPTFYCKSQPVSPAR
jgi:hypothetical protein